MYSYCQLVNNQNDVVFVVFCSERLETVLRCPKYIRLLAWLGRIYSNNSFFLKRKVNRIILFDNQMAAAKISITLNETGRIM